MVDVKHPLFNCDGGLWSLGRVDGQVHRVINLKVPQLVEVIVICAMAAVRHLAQTKS